MKLAYERDNWRVIETEGRDQPFAVHRRSRKGDQTIWRFCFTEAEAVAYIDAQIQRLEENSA